MSTKIHPLTLLSQEITNATDKVSYWDRLCRTIHLVKEKKGTVAAVGTATGVVFAGAYTALFSYFCFEGTARALHDCYTSVQEEGRLSQDIGDAGGWGSLPLFSFFSFRRALNQLMREGDFAQIKSISLKDQPSAASLYTHLNDVLDQLAGQCFIYKSVLECRLLSLELVTGNADPCSDLSLDRQLKETYQEIEEERKVSYLTRLQTSCNARDASQSKVSRIITGIVCPIFLSLGAMCSAIGEPILGQKVIGEKEEQTEIGHFGEWPDNIVSSSAVAYFLHRDLLTKGDIAIATDIFQNHLTTLENNRPLYNRLCTVAKQEVQQLSSQMTFSRSLQLSPFHPLPLNNADECKLEDGLENHAM